MSTVTMLGALRTEAARFDEPEGQGTPAIHMFRPAGTPLRNDGIWRYWMASGNTYRLSWDRVGWQVTCETWLSGHTYRLVDSDAQFVSSLPLTDGVHELDPGKAYELRETNPPGGWEVWVHAVE